MAASPVLPHERQPPRSRLSRLMWFIVGAGTKNSTVCHVELSASSTELSVGHGTIGNFPSGDVWFTESPSTRLGGRAIDSFDLPHRGLRENNGLRLAEDGLLLADFPRFSMSSISPHKRRRTLPVRSISPL